jgi:hypothetical protein
MSPLRIPAFRRVARILAICCATALGAHAQESAPERGAPDEEHLIPGRFQAIRQMSESELKSFYLACSGMAMRTRLGAGSIAECSTAYQLLLTKAFGGDFHAFLQWRRSQRPGRVDSRIPEP